MYMYAKELSEPKNEFLIKKREDARIKHLNDRNAFTEGLNTMDDVNEDIDDYKPTRKINILIVFDDMIADIMENKKIQAVVKELFIRCRKLNTLLVFTRQSCFSVPKDVKINTTYYLIMKMNNQKKKKKKKITKYCNNSFCAYQIKIF